MSFFNELKRRNVFRVGIAYVLTAWLVAQIADLVLDNIEAPDWVMQTLMLLLALGFPFVLLFAWAFELTPEGIRKEKEVDRTASISDVTGQKLNYTIMALMAVALSYFAFDKFVLDPGGDAAEIGTAGQLVEEGRSVAAETAGPGHSIAVLPFADLSPEGDNAYFSDGLTEELLNILSKISELRVAGRTSSFAFKGKGEDLRSIGEKLNVKTILEGSVRKDDQRNRVRITAQLINATDGYHLWSESYDRDLDDIFAIQQEIAEEVARALRITLLGEGATALDPVANTEFSAYDLYLKALQGINEGGFDSLDRAVDQLQQALTIDPSYLPARLALVYAWSRMANTGAISREEAVSRGLPLLETVLGAQPDNSEAHVQLALLKRFENDHAAAEREFTRALELDPENARGLQEYGRYLFNRGEVERGIELIGEALKIEPYATRILWDQCQTNAYLQRVEAALAACARIREIEPDSPLGYYGWALAHLYSGDVARGMKGYLEALQKDPGDYEMIGAMAIFWTSLGDAGQAGQWLQRAEAIGAGQPVPINARIYLYQFQEQYDLAGDLARRALDQDMDDRHGTNSIFRQAIAFTSLQNGDFEEALRPYREVYPWAFQDALEPPADLAPVVDDLITMAGLLKLAEPLSGRSEALLQLAEPLLEVYFPGLGPWHADVRKARVATIRGNHDGATQYLSRVWDKKFRTFWRTDLVNDPVISQLNGVPAYQELIARYEREMERQREATYAMLGLEQ
jgi:TolB-like protein/Tfp pilus assembly protein PilF